MITQDVKKKEENTPLLVLRDWGERKVEFLVWD